MAMTFGAAFLSFAVLLLGISIEVCHTREICTLQLISREAVAKQGEVHDDTSTGERHKRYSWVCKESAEFSTRVDNYELEDEEPNKRVRRGWGSRRRSSFSSRTSSRSWGSRRRSFSSSGSGSRIWGSSRMSSSSSRSNSRIWGSRRRSSSSSGSGSRIWGSRQSSARGRSSGKSSKAIAESKSESDKSGVWDKVHTALDVAGMAPGIGNVADGINAGLHAARGNWKDAGLSAAGMIPGVGQSATAAKHAKKTGKAIKRLLKWGRRKIANRTIDVQGHGN